MTNKMGTQSPKGSVCARCGEEIPTGVGRRYRMKWMHEHCLPPTRLARIDHYREIEKLDGETAAKVIEVRTKHAAEEAERIRHAIRSASEKMKRRPKRRN